MSPTNIYEQLQERRLSSLKTEIEGVQLQLENDGQAEISVSSAVGTVRIYFRRTMAETGTAQAQAFCTARVEIQEYTESAAHDHRPTDYESVFTQSVALASDDAADMAREIMAGMRDLLDRITSLEIDVERDAGRPDPQLTTQRVPKNNRMEIMTVSSGLVPIEASEEVRESGLGASTGFIEIQLQRQVEDRIAQIVHLVERKCGFDVPGQDSPSSYSNAQWEAAHRYPPLRVHPAPDEPEVPFVDEDYAIGSPLASLAHEMRGAGVFFLSEAPPKRSTILGNMVRLCIDPQTQARHTALISEPEEPLTQDEIATVFTHGLHALPEEALLRLARSPESVRRIASLLDNFDAVEANAHESWKNGIWDYMSDPSERIAA